MIHVLALARSARKVIAVRQTLRKPSCTASSASRSSRRMRKAIPYAMRPTRSYSSASASRLRVRRARRGPRRRGGRDRLHRPGSRAGRGNAYHDCSGGIIALCSLLTGRRVRFIRTDRRRPANKRRQDTDTKEKDDAQRHRDLGARRSLRRRRDRAAVTLGPGDGPASSHREARCIAEDPSADLTDVYAFRSPDKPGTVTLLANVHPGRGSGCGAELVHVLARRSIQPEDRHERRRQAERDLPVPVPSQDRPVSSSATPPSRSR